jgi:predicted DNA-binding WGR domain protein
MNTLTQTESDNITLYYREGNSDKVYQAAIEPAGDGLFAVTFAYGRRGSTLSTGTKTNSPVNYDDAMRIFEKLVREQMAKGYTPGADGTPYVGSNGDKQPSGYLPQLLNPIDEAEVQRLLRDNVHVSAPAGELRAHPRRGGSHTTIRGWNDAGHAGLALAACRRITEDAPHLRRCLPCH